MRESLWPAPPVPACSGVLGSGSSLPCMQKPRAKARLAGWGSGWLRGFGLPGEERGELGQQPHLVPPYETLQTPTLDPFWGPCLLSPIE